MRLFPLTILIMFSVLAIKVISIVFDQSPIVIGVTEVLAAQDTPEDMVEDVTAGDEVKKQAEEDKRNVDQLLLNREKKGLVQSFTNSEIELLQSLKSRRDLLDKREKKIDLQAKLLEAAEKQLDEKIEKLQVLEAAVKEKLGEVNEKEANRFVSLVKTYEAMKPKDAANILSILDLSIMEKITRSMSIKKLAPILAKMDMKAARALTIRLAQPPLELSVKDLEASKPENSTTELPKLNLE